MERYEIVRAARLYHGDIAISVLERQTDRSLAAQAADELLTISGISASFVLFPEADKVIISARSIGETNVQVILESLGGRQHRTAGAQLENVTVQQALAELVAAIDKILRRIELRNEGDPSTGYQGAREKDDIVEVSDGYARNYLLPRNLAVQATADNLNSAKQWQRPKRAARPRKEDAQALAEKLRSCEAVIKRAPERPKLFGAVTSQEISDAFKKQFDLDIDKKRIIQDEPIKQYGRYELKYKLGSEVTGPVRGRHRGIAHLRRAQTDSPLTSGRGRCTARHGI